MNEEQEFRAVFRFLENVTAEVSGRMGVDPDLDARLQELANGRLDGARRESLLAEIARDSQAVSRLARYLRTESGS